MDLKQLEYFLHIAETLNFSSAAEKFHTTQPTISRQISNLETELGVPLFARSHHNVRLTPEGTALYPYAQRIVGQKNEFLLLLQQSIDRKAKKKVRCLLPTELDAKFAAFARSVMARHPDLELIADRIRHARLEQAITDKTADVFFVRDSSFFQLFPQYSTEVLFEDYYALVIRKADIEKYQEYGFAALDNAPFGIANPLSLPTPYSQINQATNLLGIAPQIVKAYDSFTALLMATRANLINSIVPMGLAKEITDALVLPLFSDETKIQYCISYIPGISTRVDNFVADCIAYFKGDDNTNNNSTGIVWKVRSSDTAANNP